MKTLVVVVTLLPLGFGSVVPSATLLLLAVEGSVEGSVVASVVAFPWWCCRSLGIPNVPLGLGGMLWGF